MAVRSPEQRVSSGRPYDYPDAGDARPAREAMPQQQLAAGVIRQALFDAQNSCLAPAVREQARLFLTGGDGLRFWCDVAGLDVHAVRTLAAQMIGTRPSRRGRPRLGSWS